jgi:nucleoside-diphosphate-sugar epimerase
MNVFITGATGVLGRTVARLLVDSGHTVRALARTPANESRIREIGAEPVHTSLFEPSMLRNTVKNTDAILHLATHIPPRSKAGHLDAWLENDRIRREGTRNLVDAAIEEHVPTFLYPSIVFFYPDRGANWLDETTPPDPTPILQSSLSAEKEVEHFTKSGGRGLILRMGAFYGPAAESTRDMLHAAHYGIAAFFGRSKAYLPLIWIDDAALAVLDSLSQAPAGIYDIVDDEPLQRGELARALAETVGKRHLFRPPKLVLRFLGGKHTMFLARSQRVSNKKFKSATNWSPMIPSAKLGFRLLSIPP